MAGFVVLAENRRRVFQILDDDFFVGSADQCTLRLSVSGVPRRALRVVATQGGHTVDVLTDDGTPDITKRRTLSHGDVLRLGRDATLVYWADGASGPPPSPPTLDIQPIRSVQRSRVRRPKRRRGMPTWLLLSNLVVLIAIVSFVYFNWLGERELTREPEDMITLAESQRRAGDFELALRTLASAVDRGPDADARRRIEEMQRRIREQAQRGADSATLVRARQRANTLQRLHRMYFVDREPGRPEARELVRIARAWREEFEAVCARYADKRELIDEVGKYERDHGALAVLDESDTADDILFVGDRKVRLRKRRYPEAIRILESWLGENPGADGADRVAAQISSWRDEGASWVSSRLESVERMVARGQTEQALDELRFLRDEGTLPEWRGDLDARIDQLERARR